MRIARPSQPLNLGFGWLVYLVLGMIGLCIALSLAGCSSEPIDLAPIKEQSSSVRASIAEAETAQRDALAKAQASGDTKGAEAAQKALDTLATAKKYADDADAAIGRITNPDGTLNPDAATSAFGTAIMGINPLAGVGVLLAGSVFANIRQRQNAAKAKADAEAKLAAAKAATNGSV